MAEVRYNQGCKCWPVRLQQWSLIRYRKAADDGELSTIACGLANKLFFFLVATARMGWTRVSTAREKRGGTRRDCSCRTGVVSSAAFFLLYLNQGSRAVNRRASPAFGAT
jgi:hypothetical protein